MDENSVIADVSKVEKAFNSVHAAAAYEVVADTIRNAIALRRFLPGEKLPAERELANQMTVSRTTIREAVRVLEGEGLVKVKRGATGGLVVLRPMLLEAEDAGLYLKNQLTMLDDILDFRKANESVAAKLAAERRSPEQLARLERLFETMSELRGQEDKRADTSLISQFLATDSEFHLTIADAGRNKLIAQAINDARAAMFLPVGRVFVRLEDESHAHHEEIYSAIKDGDGDRAASAMGLHIEATRSSLHNLVPSITEVPTA